MIFIWIHVSKVLIDPEVSPREGDWDDCTQGTRERRSSEESQYIESQMFFGVFKEKKIYFFRDARRSDRRWNGVADSSQPCERWKERLAPTQREGLRERGASFTLLNTHTHTHTQIHKHTHTHTLGKAVLRLREKRNEGSGGYRTARSLSKLYIIYGYVLFGLF